MVSTEASPPTPAAAGIPDVLASPPAGSLQFTFRAVVTGMVLGAVLAISNIYAGLKFGAAFNMSIVAILVGYALWAGIRAVSGGRVRPWGMLENNISQTGCTGAAFVASAGVTAQIPAYTALTGKALPLPALMLWIFSVCLVGVLVAVGLRRQMVVVQQLPFAAGTASAATLREVYAAGRAAARRVWAMLMAALVAGRVCKLQQLDAVSGLALPGAVRGFPLESLTFKIEPSLFPLAIGGLIGLRASASVLLGAVLCWGVLAPAALAAGYVKGPPQYGPLLQWTLWPGVALMVAASLTSAAFAWRTWLGALRALRARGAGGAAETASRTAYGTALAGALGLSAVLQIVLFGVVWWAALGSVLLAFVLALVAARVSGETGMNPVGPMGKVSQITFGALLPDAPAANLMAANVTAGAASQCADMMNDFRCGQLLGAAPRLQVYSQVLGALVGSIVGAVAYVLLVPEPARLPTVEFAAPAVVSMKAVAELFRDGLAAMPKGVQTAALIAAAGGVALAVAEQVAPRRIRAWVPSAASMGLAFVFPASLSLGVFLGASAAWGMTRWRPGWAQRYLLVICAGLVAGDALTGFGISLRRMLFP